eukprot:9269951-Pyramimonas_sp.AAC.1
MDMPIDPKKIRTLVGCPPWKRDHVAVVARFCGAWRSQASAQVQVEIGGEICPPRSQIWIQAVPNLRPVCFATYTNTTEAWALHADAWAETVSVYHALTVPIDTVLQEVNRWQWRSRRLVRGMRLGSWSLNKAGAAHFRCADILHPMRACGGLFACQVSQYLVQVEFERVGWRINISSCSKAALSFDRSWVAAVRMFFTCFMRFVIGVFGSKKPRLIVNAAYLPDPHVEDCAGIVTEVYEQINRARDGVRAKLSQASFCVLLGSNAGVPPGCKL